MLTLPCVSYSPEADRPMNQFQHETQHQHSALKRLEYDRDGKRAAMVHIRQERVQWQSGHGPHVGKTTAAFAAAMQIAHPVIRNPGSIKNAITRWCREVGPTGGCAD